MPLLTKKRINRYNKIAMLGSLAASLGRKRWRQAAATGYLFVADLGEH